LTEALVESGKLVEMLRKMLEIRRFEEAAFRAYGQNLIPGTIHLYIGEEAVAVGVCSALRGDDYITSTHRGHGHCIAKGADMNRMMAEVFGKRTGYCKGKGGSMHIADFGVGMLGATGIVASFAALAAGVGLAIRLRRSDQVVACFFGEGGANQGILHEALNLAAIWSLPVIFVCENNLYAMGTRVSRAVRIENIADRAPGYGMPGRIVDGNDVEAVYAATVEAAERARRGEGPTFIECKTYRKMGHSRFDPGTYRPREEVEEWLRRDPIERLKGKLLKESVVTEAEFEALDKDVQARVEAAIAFATQAPLPAPEEALEDVYAPEEWSR